MLEFDTKIRRWGNSLGIIIPKKEAEIYNVKKNDILHFIAIKRNKNIKKTFGALKNWKSGQQIKDTLRRELYG